MKKMIKGKFQWLQQMIIKRWNINQIKIQMLSDEIVIISYKLVANLLCTCYNTLDIV